MNASVEQSVRNFLDAQYLKHTKDDDTWHGEIYADYSDELSDEQITKVVSDSDPSDALVSLIYDAYYETEWDYKSDLIKDLERKWNEEIGVWDELEEEIREFIDEHVFYDIPYDHYANQTVYVDIMLDTGDGNYDFTLNCVYPHYDGTYKEKINDSASIVHLAKWQGYSKTQVNRALFDEEFAESKFLKSLRAEVLNCSSHMNAIVFLVEMTLRECIELNERIAKAQTSEDKSARYHPSKYKSRDSIHIPAKSTCGLYDPWNGAGSILEIEIEKGFDLPLKYIDSAWPDGARGYSISEVYGVTRKLWDGIEIGKRKAA